MSSSAQVLRWRNRERHLGRDGCRRPADHRGGHLRERLLRRGRQAVPRLRHHGHLHCRTEPLPAYGRASWRLCMTDVPITHTKIPVVLLPSTDSHQMLGHRGRGQRGLARVQRRRRGGRHVPAGLRGHHRPLVHWHDHVAGHVGLDRRLVRACVHRPLGETRAEHALRHCSGSMASMYQSSGALRCRRPFGGARYHRHVPRNPGRLRRRRHVRDAVARPAAAPVLGKRHVVRQHSPEPVRRYV